MHLLTGLEEYARNSRAQGFREWLDIWLPEKLTATNNEKT